MKYKFKPVPPVAVVLGVVIISVVAMHSACGMSFLYLCMIYRHQHYHVAQVRKGARITKCL
ncbi:hypothetical protein BDQ12DRAFT_394592 [Crucibulum laeve]|uniref:Uncharacterized protein n=1 Tax=Crucibulum laeve TaxID=68775 RepID=A0A5C3M901_9AGAR|nr:hypothetical protein BDQ12DRAFT_394592 [Crucibulum laeve]